MTVLDIATGYGKEKYAVASRGGSERIVKADFSIRYEGRRPLPEATMGPAR
jgi:hypothetical protein